MEYHTKLFSRLTLFVFTLCLSISSANQVFAEALNEVSSINTALGDQIIHIEWTNPSSIELAGILVVKSSDNITWSATDGTVYNINQEVSPGVNVIYYTTGNELNDIAVINGEKYYYKIFTFNYEAEYSLGSNILSLSPYKDTYKPVPPTGLAVSIYSDTAFLNWTESSSDDVKEYKVVCENYNDGLDLNKTVKINSTEFYNFDSTIPYGCYVTAIDFSGNESLRSNTVNTNSSINKSYTELSLSFENNISLNWHTYINSSYSNYIVLKSLTQITNSLEQGVIYEINNTLADGSKVVYKGNQKTYTDSAYDLKTTYFYQVIPVISEVNYANPSNQVFIVPPSKTGIDVQTDSSVFLAGIPNNNQVTLSWNKPQGVISAGAIVVKSPYPINWNPSKNTPLTSGNTIGNISIIYNGSETNFTDTNIINNSLYRYKVFYHDSNYDYLPGSNEITVTPPGTVLGNKYGFLNLGAITQNSKIVLSWNTPNKKTLLVRSRKPINFIPPNGISYSTGQSIDENTDIIFLGNNTTYTDGSVKTYDSYYYRAFTQTDSLEYSEPSNQIVASLTIGAFPYAGGSTNKNINLGIFAEGGDNLVKLFWNDATSPSYLLVRSDENISWQPTNGIFYNIGDKIGDNLKIIYTDSNNQYNDSEVVNNQTYYYRLFSVDDNKQYSLGSNQITITPPHDQMASNKIMNTTPPIRLIGSVKHLAVLLNWNNDPTENSIAYNIYYKKKSDSTYKKANKHLIYEQQYEVANLEDATAYDFYVTGINKELTESTPSQIKSYTALKDTKVPSFIGAVKAMTANNQISLSWHPAIDSNLLGYNIYINGNLLQGSPFKQYPVTLTNVENHKDYKIKITAVDKAGNEGDGTESLITPPSSNFAFVWNINDYLDNDSENIINEGEIDLRLNDDGRPRVLWDKKFDNSQIVGFQIFKGEDPSSLELINKDFLLSYPPYTDNKTISQRTYYYQFKSIDKDGQISKSSDILAIKSKDASNAGPFNDVLENHTFFNFVEKLRLNLIVQGYDGHIYKPNSYISREEALKMIMESAEVPLNEKIRFNDYTDVLTSDWSYKYIQNGSIEGIVRGYDDGFFRPRKNVSRIEFLKMVLNAGEVITDNTYVNPFPDLANDFWGTEYVKTAVKGNIISGYSDGLFKPDQAITRAEAAKIVSYLLP
jgi:hypothetical protein